METINYGAGYLFWSSTITVIWMAQVKFLLKHIILCSIKICTHGPGWFPVKIIWLKVPLVKTMMFTCKLTCHIAAPFKQKHTPAGACRLRLIRSIPRIKRVVGLWRHKVTLAHSCPSHDSKPTLNTNNKKQVGGQYLRDDRLVTVGGIMKSSATGEDNH